MQIENYYSDLYSPKTSIAEGKLRQFQIETTIAESNGKRAFHDVKWKKFLLNNRSSSGSL